MARHSNLVERMRVLERAARFDLCGDCDVKGARARQRTASGQWLYPQRLPDGQNSIMLKVLMSNACENDCLYCVNRKSRSYPRATLQPGEVVDLFLNYYRKGFASALFLSSGVLKNSDYSMERITAVLKCLRFKHRIPCYIHTKILPGASEESIAETVALSNRVSINLEVPEAHHLCSIAPEKDFQGDLINKIEAIQSLCMAKERGRCDQTTQFVVGAAGETDREILSRTTGLYSQNRLSRVYFSAFQHPNGEMDSETGNRLLDREHRLYQCDFLFRKYGFQYEELLFNKKGHLPLEKDPKQAWVERHPEAFPIEVNKASKNELMRVPGIGPTLSSRILRVRRERAIASPRVLGKIGVPLQKAGPYLLLGGKRNTLATPVEQKELWA